MQYILVNNGVVFFFFFYLAYFVPLFFVDLKSFQAAENPLGAVYGDSVFWVVTKGGWPTNGRCAEEEALLRWGRASFPWNDKGGWSQVPL